MFRIFLKSFDFFYSTTFGRFLQMAALKCSTFLILSLHWFICKVVIFSRCQVLSRKMFQVEESIQQVFPLTYSSFYIIVQYLFLLRYNLMCHACRYEWETFNKGENSNSHAQRKRIFHLSTPNTTRAFYSTQ